MAFILPIVIMNLMADGRLSDRYLLGGGLGVYFCDDSRDSEAVSREDGHGHWGWVLQRIGHFLVLLTCRI